MNIEKNKLTVGQEATVALGVFALGCLGYAIYSGYGQLIFTILIIIFVIIMIIVSIPLFFKGEDGIIIAPMCWMMAFVGAGMFSVEIPQRIRWYEHRTGEKITEWQAFVNRYGKYSVPDGIEFGSGPEDYAHPYLYYRQ